MIELVEFPLNPVWVLSPVQAVMTLHVWMTTDRFLLLWPHSVNHTGQFRTDLLTAFMTLILFRPHNCDLLVLMAQVVNLECDIHHIQQHNTLWLRCRRGAEPCNTSIWSTNIWGRICQLVLALKWKTPLMRKHKALILRDLRHSCK